jgi:hypothetical protein
MGLAVGVGVRLGRGVAAAVGGAEGGADDSDPEGGAEKGLDDGGGVLWPEQPTTLTASRETSSRPRIFHLCIGCR